MNNLKPKTTQTLTNTINENMVSNFDLSHDNTMALSCMAKQGIVLKGEDEIEQLFYYILQFDAMVDLLVLSGGSNVILPNYLDALVILPRYTGITILSETDENIELEVMAGNNWHELVVECTNKGWYGLENLALIPGLVGASPVQNIGAYGVQLEDCLTYVKAFHIPSQTWQTLSKEACEFAYRDSIFKQNPNTWLISRVGFKLHKDNSQINASYGDVQTEAKNLANTSGKPYPTPLEVMQAIISIRQTKLPDPNVLANTGSFFQNPIIARSQYTELLKTHAELPKYEIDSDINSERVKVPAGWLIDKAGLKGQGITPILTHEKQALVLTNHAPQQATQADIANTRDLIINTVFEKYGIELHPEPVWID